MLVVVLAVGTIVPVAAPPGALLVPTALWVALFVAFLVATAVLLMSEALRTAVLYTVYGAQVLLVGTLVVLAPGAGWLPILLVVVAAMSTYVVPVRVSYATIAVNTVVILVAYGGDGGLPEVALMAGLYLFLQVASVSSTLALTRERTMRQELAEAHVELRAAAVLRDEASRTDERLRIARELHDVLGHQLTVLTLELETATHRDGERSREHVERAKSVARDLLGDVRETVGELRRRAPELTESLGAIVRDVPAPRIELTIADDVAADEEQTVTLVRVVQEVVTNTIRHAGADVLRVEVDADPGGGLRLTARDDGRGAEPVHHGNGLRGIAERIGALGGTVDFDGSDGFRVEVALAPATTPALARGGAR